MKKLSKGSQYFKKNEVIKNIGSLRPYVYVTVKLCNQVMHVFTQNFREYTYSVKQSGNMRIPSKFQGITFSLITHIHCNIYTIVLHTR